MLDLSLLNLSSPLNLSLLFLNLEVGILFVIFVDVHFTITEVVEIVLVATEVLLPAFKSDVELIRTCAGLLLQFVEVNSALNDKTDVDFIRSFSKEVSFIFEYYGV